LLVAAAVLLLPAAAHAMHAPGGPEIRMIAEDVPVGLSIRGSLGTMAGKATRTEYMVDPTGDRRTLSQSTWALRGINFIGFEATAEIMDQVRMNIGLWRGMNEGSGSMEERRWLWLGHDWSHWQEGSVDVIEATMFDMNLGVDVVNFEGILVSLLGGWKRDTWAWLDRAGFYSGSDKAFRDVHGTYYGQNTIGYQQVYSVLYAGVDARYSAEAADFEVYLNLSPLSKSTDSIHHKTRDLEVFPGGLHTDGESSLGVYVGAGGRATYNMTDNLFASLSVDTQSFPSRPGRRKTLETNEVVDQGLTISQQAATFSGLIGWRF